MISEHLVKYHFPEYEPMPVSARAVTWITHCKDKRFMLEKWSKELYKTS